MNTSTIMGLIILSVIIVFFIVISVIGTICAFIRIFDDIFPHKRVISPLEHKLNEAKEFFGSPELLSNLQKQKRIINICKILSNPAQYGELVNKFDDEDSCKEFCRNNYEISEDVLDKKFKNLSECSRHNEDGNGYQKLGSIMMFYREYDEDNRPDTTTPAVDDPSHILIVYQNYEIFSVPYEAINQKIIDDTPNTEAKDLSSVEKCISEDRTKA